MIEQTIEDSWTFTNILLKWISEILKENKQFTTLKYEWLQE